MAIDYEELKDEIDNDPRSYGYSGQEDNVVSAKLNELRGGITIYRGDVTRAELFEAIDTRDVILTPSAMQFAYLQGLAAVGMYRLKTHPGGANTRVMDNLERLVTNTNGTEGRLAALAERTGSRAEELFGQGTVVTDTDVAVARNM